MVSDLDIGTVEQQQILQARQEEGKGRPWSSIFTSARQGEFVKWSIDQEDVLSKLDHSCHGEIKINGVWQKKGVPLMNDEGINALLAIISSRYHKGLILGNLSENQTRTILKETCLLTADFVFHNCTKYEIAPANYDLIVMMVKHLMECGLSRAEGANEKRWISTIQQIREVIGGSGSSSSQANKGFLSKVFGGGNNGGAMQ